MAVHKPMAEQLAFEVTVKNLTDGGRRRTDRQTDGTAIIFGLGYVVVHEPMTEQLAFEVGDLKYD